jgi:hypothetical protein
MFKHTSYDSVRFILPVLKIWTEWVLTATGTFCVIFKFLTMFNTGTIVEAGAVGASSLYGSGSDQKMRLRVHNTASILSLPESPPPPDSILAEPMLSISSMKMMEGACSLRNDVGKFAVSKTTGN